VAGTQERSAILDVVAGFDINHTLAYCKNQGVCGECAQADQGSSGLMFFVLRSRLPGQSEGFQARQHQAERK